MNPENCALAAGLVSLSYVRQGEQALVRRQRQVKALLSSRRLPERGWDESSIEMLIRDCSAMDSNNFLDNVGLGEREGRIACPAVARRHFGLAHGIGRSGDVAAEQPKAAGSSLLAAITVDLAADALRIAGLTGIGALTLLPLATGMTITLVLLAARQQRPAGADIVLWSRVDQKTCLKAVAAAGLVPRVVGLVRRGEELVTDVQGMDDAITSLGAERIAAIVTTTSCFAPRAPDDVAAVAALAAKYDIPHIVNNAYGIQSAETCRTLAAAWRDGGGARAPRRRVDAVVQSTDKNFMVPVGGALVAAPACRPGLVAAVNSTYPGRAAVAAHLDLLMTLLHWGAEGWRRALSEREALAPYLRSRLSEVAARQGERLLATPGNPISCAISLDSLVGAAEEARREEARREEVEKEVAGRGKQMIRKEEEGREEKAQTEDGDVDERAGGREVQAAAAANDGEEGDGEKGKVAVEVKVEAGAHREGEACPKADAATSKERQVSDVGAAVGAARGCEGGVVEREETEGKEAEGAVETEVAEKGGGCRDPTQGAAAGHPVARSGPRSAPDLTFFGSMLWCRCVSGTRVVAPGKTQTICGIKFANYGSHTDELYGSTYLTAAGALGTTRADVDELIVRLERCFAEFRKKCRTAAVTAEAAAVPSNQQPDSNGGCGVKQGDL